MQRDTRYGTVITIDNGALSRLLDRERLRYRAEHPGSLTAYRTADHLLGRVPMTWMNMWSGGFPLSFSTARGNRITDVDGNQYLDFALGDTGAMAGHSPSATVAAVQQRIAVDGGITTMLPNADAEWVGGELSRPLRPADLVVLAVRDRRESLGHPAGPAGDRAAEDPGLLPLLPRLGGRDVRRART